MNKICDAAWKYRRKQEQSIESTRCVDTQNINTLMCVPIAAVACQLVCSVNVKQGIK